MKKTFVNPDLKGDEFLKEQLELSGKRSSELQNLLTELGGQMHGLWLDLHFLSSSVKERSR